MLHNMKLEADEFEDTDIPTTTILSKADIADQQRFTNVSASDIVINKLIDIWASIRQGSRQRQRRREREAAEAAKAAASSATAPTLFATGAGPAPSAAAVVVPAKMLPSTPLDDIK